MDLVAWDDLKASRGVQMLQGKADTITEEHEPWDITHETRKEKKDKEPMNGLDIGRRLLVVVKTEEVVASDSRSPSSSPRHKDTGSKKAGMHQVRIVDHGGTQKEAIRRLFEAQVLLRSYEEQLTERDKQLWSLRADLTNLARQPQNVGTNAAKVGVVNFVPSAKPMTAASEIPSSMGEFPSPPQTAGTIGTMETVDENGKTIHEARPVPKWLKSDEKSRLIIDLHRKNLYTEYTEDGDLDNNKVADHLWQTALDIAERWSGGPDEEVKKQAEKATLQLRKTQRQCLEETSMLRAHIKKVERKYKELQGAAQQMQESSGKKVGSSKGGHIPEMMKIPSVAKAGGMQGSLDLLKDASAVSKKAAGAARGAAAAAADGAHGIQMQQMQQAQEQQVKQMKEVQKALQAAASGGDPAAAMKQLETQVKKMQQDAQQQMKKIQAAGGDSPQVKEMQKQQQQQLQQIQQIQQAVQAAASGGGGSPQMQQVQQAQQQQVQQLQEVQQKVQQAVQAAAAAGGAPPVAALKQLEQQMQQMAQAAEEQIQKIQASGGSAQQIQELKQAQQQQVQQIKQIQQAVQAASSGGGDAVAALKQVSTQIQEVQQTAQKQEKEIQVAAKSSGGGDPAAALRQVQQQVQEAQQTQQKQVATMQAVEAEAAEAAGGFPSMPKAPRPGAELTKPKTLLEDEDIPYKIDAEELGAMDSELFEPLTQFDKDMQEMLIDIVDEKVRRILQMDPDNYKDGLLPFGLRPDNVDPNEKIELQNAESKRLMLVSEVQDLQLRNQGLQGTIAELRNAPPPAPVIERVFVQQQGAPSQAAAQEVMTASPAVSRGRGFVENREESKEVVAAGPAGFSPEMVDQIVEKKCKELKEQIKKLTAMMSDLNGQLKEAQNKKPEVIVKEAKEKEAPPPKKEKIVDPKNPHRPDITGPDGVPTCPNCDRTDKVPEKVYVEKEVKVKKEKPVKAEEEKPVESDDDVESIAGMDEPHMKDLIRMSPKARARAAIQRLVQSNKSLAASQLVIHRVLEELSNKFAVEPTYLGHTKIIKILGEDGTKPKAAEYREKEAIDAYNVWASDVMEVVEKPAPVIVQKAATPVETPKAAAPVKKEESLPQKKEEKPAPVVKPDTKEKDAVIDRHLSEIAALKYRMKTQQDEMSKLLLTVDEMRARIEKIKEAAMQVGGPETQELVGSVMGRVGLKDMMEAKEAKDLQTPKLKGVFERLYMDSVQRIQRLGLIRERMVLANQAYSAVAGAIDGTSQEQAPDIDRLGQTTQIALRGMWYHTEYLFKHACEYAMSQGVENCASNRPTLEDLMQEQEDPELEAEKLRQQRLPGRRSDRRNEKQTFAQSMNSPDPKNSPRTKRMQAIQDATTTNFTSYVANLRQARGDLGKEEWPNCVRKEPQRQHVKSDGEKLGALVGNAGKKSPKGLANSQSLPMLRKDSRSILEQNSQNGEEGQSRES